jgi:hypothetical protein
MFGGVGEKNLKTLIYLNSVLHQLKATFFTYKSKAFITVASHMFKSEQHKSEDAEYENMSIPGFLIFMFCRTTVCITLC